jgi:hypothetical protein
VPEPNVSPWQKKRPTPTEERQRKKNLDDAYNAARKKIPDQKTNDPWAMVRPPAAPAPERKQQ